MKRCLTALLLVLSLTSCVTENQTYLVSCPSWEDFDAGRTRISVHDKVEGFIYADVQGVVLAAPNGARFRLAPTCDILNLDGGSGWVRVGWWSYWDQPGPMPLREPWR